MPLNTVINNNYQLLLFVETVASRFPNNRGIPAVGSKTHRQIGFPSNRSFEFQKIIYLFSFSYTKQCRFFLTILQIEI